MSSFPWRALSRSLRAGSSVPPSFDGFATGQPFGDFLLGIPRTASRAADAGPYYGSANEWAVFFMDDWKMTPRLTLNLGLRYERHIPWVEENDRLHTFDPDTGSIVVPVPETISKIHPLFPAEIPVITAANAGFPDRSMIRTDSNDIAPRFGFAWRSGFHDLVVRGGYGIFYNFESRKGFRNMTAGPFVATETFDNILTAGVPVWSWPQAFPTGPARPLTTQNISATAVDRDSSYSQQWNLTLEKEIAGYGVRLSYIGTVSKQLPFVRNLNQPFPSPAPFSQNLRPFPVYRDISYVDRGANQDFHSPQVQVTRRLSRGFSLNAHYTYEKNLTDSPDSSIFGNTIENAWNRDREWGNEEYGLRHRFISYFNWDAPVGRGRSHLNDLHPIAEGFLGGWAISGHIAANSGMWYTPYFTGRDVSNTNVTSGRPDRSCDGNKPSGQRDVNNWFDYSSCFSLPAAGAGRFGNAGRGIIEGPEGFWGVNLGLYKYFTLREQLRVRLQGHLQNIFNHPRFRIGGNQTDAGMNLVSPSVGRITRSPNHVINDIWSERQIEVGVRVEF